MASVPTTIISVLYTALLVSTEAYRTLCCHCFERQCGYVVMSQMYLCTHNACGLWKFLILLTTTSTQIKVNGVNKFVYI